MTSLQLRLFSVMSECIADCGEIVDEDPIGWIHNDLNPQDFSKSWATVYGMIYQADLILDNAHRFEIAEKELEPYLLQAYFAKAIAYFYLAQNFGEVPITKGSTNFDKLPQKSISEVLDEVEKLALKAFELPKYEELVQQTSFPRMKQYGSKGAVAALLAHLYAWRAGVEGKSECWEKAEEYCRMIIEGEVGDYELAQDPEEVCKTVMYRDSKESIWEIYRGAEDKLFGKNSFISFPVLITSSHAPDNKIDAMIYKTTVNHMYPEGDKRRDAYFWGMDADSVYLNYENGEIIASVERGQDSVIMAYDNKAIKRAYLYKFRYPYYEYDDTRPQPSFSGMNQNKVIWRLSEIYLLRAECRARQKKANAVEDLNTVRRRAYGDDSHAFPCIDDVEQGLVDNIQLAIFREREKELLQEYHRYFDIVRNGWCYLRGEDSYDYIREELSVAYSGLTNQDIEDGALYYMLGANCFVNNDLIRQNKYWNRRQQ